MISDIVIRAEGIGKKYLIGHHSAERESYTNLRDVIGHAANRLGLSALDMVRGRQLIAGDEIEEFWALKDVSFEIKRGEVLGIIGRNGAGKSTLLKILSRITEPSEGHVRIEGRVASLLEVGTGFHPELTGRENVYLNGAILGMARTEVKRQFDEIIDFAGVEKFIDTPVKRYSNGMRIRLGFAVAAYLEPEVLIIDEVLAVGDIDFQRKCLRRMEDVSNSGRTVLFVSHNINSVRRICSRCIMLEKGLLHREGNVESVLNDFLQMQGRFGKSATRGSHYLRSVQTKSDCGERSENFSHEQAIVIDVSYEAPRPPSNFVLAVRVSDLAGNVLFTSWDTDEMPFRPVQSDGDYHERCTIPPKLLRPGDYHLMVFLLDRVDGGGVIDSCDLNLRINELGSLHGPMRLGLIAPHIGWEMLPRADAEDAKDADDRPSNYRVGTDD